VGQHSVLLKTNWRKIKMTKRFTSEELQNMGMDEQQIVAIMSTYEREDAEAAKVVLLPQPEPQKQLQVTSIDQIRNYAAGSVVELPGFGPDQPFVARLRRPSLLVMVKSGKIPNSLIEQATALFAKGADSMVGQGKNTLGEMCDIIDRVIEAALIEPSIKDIEAAGMELSDDQKMAIFSYTQSGVKALEQFRTK